jgi:hypothetical protein
VERCLRMTRGTNVPRVIPSSRQEIGDRHAELAWLLDGAMMTAEKGDRGRATVHMVEGDSLVALRGWCRNSVSLTAASREG